MEYYNHPDSVIEVYADVSCTVPESRKEAKAFFKRLQGFFANPRVRSRVLFGSDWWMFIMQCEEQEYLHYTFTKWAKKSFYPDKALPDFNLRLQFEENAREFLPDQAAGKRKGAGAGG
jgi:hypothetical protein